MPPKSSNNSNSNKRNKGITGSGKINHFHRPSRKIPKTTVGNPVPGKDGKKDN